MQPQPLKLKTQNTLVLPYDIIQRYKTSKFTLIPLEGVLLLEPEEDDSPTHTLTLEEENKLKQSINEPSSPISQLKSNL